MVTLDKNFGELATVHGSAHSGILRLVNISAKQQASVCLSVIAVHGKELEAGATVTAEPGRLRVRLPDVAECENEALCKDCSGNPRFALQL